MGDYVQWPALRPPTGRGCQPPGGKAVSGPAGGPSRPKPDRRSCCCFCWPCLQGPSACGAIHRISRCLDWRQLHLHLHLGLDYMRGISTCTLSATTGTAKAAGVATSNWRNNVLRRSTPARAPSSSSCQRTLWRMRAGAAMAWPRTRATWASGCSPAGGRGGSTGGGGGCGSGGGGGGEARGGETFSLGREGILRLVPEGLPEGDPEDIGI